MVTAPVPTSDIDSKNIPASAPQLPVIAMVCGANMQDTNEDIDEQTEIERLKAENAKLLKQNNQFVSELVAMRRMYNMTGQNFARERLKLKMREQKCYPEVRLFGRFEKLFGATTIHRLKMLEISSRKDSTFVLECMKKLFGNDERLKYISACGRKHKAHKLRKSILSPKKREIMDDIFIERLLIKQTDEIEINQRYFRLDELIKNAIDNIAQAKSVKKASKKRVETSRSKGGPDKGNVPQVMTHSIAPNRNKPVRPAEAAGCARTLPIKLAEQPPNAGEIKVSDKSMTDETPNQNI